MPTIPVPKIKGLGESQFVRDFVEPGRPVILDQMASKWPAIAAWTPDRLKERCGHSQLAIEHYPDGNPINGRTEVKITLGQFFDLLLSDEEHRRYYLGEAQLSKTLPELSGDLGFDALVSPTLPEHRIQVFLGRDSVSPLHYHAREEAVLTQVFGDKRVLLFAPDQTKNMYPNPWYKLSDENFSSVQLCDEDLIERDFPQYANADGYQVVLRPGDMLYIPVHWWHAVYGLDMSFSTTVFWRAPRRRWRFPSPGFRVVAQAALHKVSLSTGTLSKRLLGRVDPVSQVLHGLGVINDVESYKHDIERRMR